MLNRGQLDCNLYRTESFDTASRSVDVGELHISSIDEGRDCDSVVNLV